MHHVAVRVADLERSTRFYLDVFGGRGALDAAMPSEMTEHPFGTPPGTVSRGRGIFFDEGVVEIFAFEPSAPTSAVDQAAANQMHFCLYVEEVRATAARVAAAGGSVLFDPMEWGECTFVYVADPDGNVIELLDVDHASWVRGARGDVPDVPG